jgi:ubiquinone/menaquinone biosynthesis C-methylase UbiE/DNA-binding transcriptional ArsR family regulator
MTSALDIGTLTAVYKLLGDETRLRVLALLQDHELAVGEIQKVLGIGQSTLSSQLALLKEQDLVAARKEGQKVFYRLPSGDGRKLALVRDALVNTTSARWRSRDARLLEKTLLERAESSREFFNAGNPEAVQNRTSPGQTWQALAEGIIGLFAGKRIVDLGCGNGRLARRFATAGNNVTGVDSSEEQIRLALVGADGAIGVDARPQHAAAVQDERAALPAFVLAPMERTGLPDASFDIAVISQSLHHASDPAAAIREAYRLLAPGGRLLVLDLLAHEEDWMRSKFGDFWLGFAEDDLKDWITAAGFTLAHFEITPPSPEYPELEGVLAVGEKTENEHHNITASQQ